jgi:prevent-host-death family protein
MDVGVLEAKNRLSELIERAERGERIVITRHGQPTIEFTPVRKTLSEDEIDNLFDEVRRAKANLPPYSREEILQDIHEGREERYERLTRR